MTRIFNTEESRLESFGANWPHAYMDPAKLAKTGFFFIGPSDQVKCYFCGLELGSWEMRDDEVTEHIRWAEHCPLLNQRETSNIPLDPISALYQKLPPMSHDVCGISDMQTAYRPVETTPQLTERPDFPDYSEKSTRLETFDEWLEEMREKPRQLSEAGFFFTQKEDRVICFCCGGGLYNWIKDDDPWEQHALWYPNCDYVRLIKGQKFIDAVGDKFSKNIIQNGR